LEKGFQKNIMNSSENSFKSCHVWKLPIEHTMMTDFFLFFFTKGKINWVLERRYCFGGREFGEAVKEEW